MQISSLSNVAVGCRCGWLYVSKMQNDVNVRVHNPIEHPPPRAAAARRIAN
jgi:hypothetical protein